MKSNYQNLILNDVVEFLDHKRKPITASDRNPGIYPYYGANGQQDSIDNFIFDEPLILIAEDGGHFGIKNKAIAYRVNGKCWVNNHAHVLRPKKNVDIEYLFRQLQFFDVMPFITGTTRGKLTKNAALRIPIILPPFPEQHRIATILDKADAICRKRAKTIKMLERFLRSVFLEMFGDPVRNEKGWKVGTIRDVVGKVEYGSSKPAHKSEGQYPMLRMGNITYEGCWDLSDLKYINLEENELSKYLAKKGDLLFNRTNSKELVGKTAVFEEDVPMAIAGYLIRVRFNNLANPYYVSGYLNSTHGKKTLMEMCKSIVGMANINAQELQNIKILIPPITLQNKYARIVGETRSRIAKLKNILKINDELFNSLTQRAFRGKL